MASMKTTICLSLAVLAAAVVVSTSAGSGSFCSGAGDEKALCKKMISGAKTWEEAMKNALNTFLSISKPAKSISDTIGAALPKNLRPQTKESIVSTCREGVENMIDNARQCLGFVQDDPDSSLRAYLSAISFSDCTDGLAEFGLSVPEATQLSEETLQYSSALLALAEKRP